MIIESRRQTAENRKYPKAVVGALIFNEKNELFLMKTVQWKNKYNMPGGKVEMGESLIEAVKREVKEETNLDINDIKFHNIIDGLDIGNKYTLNENHFIFIDFVARVSDYKKVKLNKEGVEYKWLKPEEWLKKKNSKFPHQYLIDEIKSVAEGYPLSSEEKYKRALADYQNLLKRTTAEKQEFAKYANEECAREILPVYDNLRLSLKHIDVAAKENGWAQGVKYVVKQFVEILKNMGVEEIAAKGKKFDPNVMEAIEGKGEKVKEVVKPGYKLKDKVILPVKVILKN